jgi:hypothetical protein
MLLLLSAQMLDLVQHLAQLAVALGHSRCKPDKFRLETWISPVIITVLIFLQSVIDARMQCEMPTD